MAADIFAKLGDIKGESLDSKHKDEIEVLSYSWGVTNSGSMTHGSGGGEGKASFHDISFVHNFDKASPILMQACATGVHMKEATISHRKASGKGGQYEYLIVKMNDVIVTGVTHGGSGDGGLQENVSLAFAKVNVEYKPQKADGSPDAGIIFKYDLKGKKEG
jgi:type VI secretion system secreted protein Hcp